MSFFARLRRALSPAETRASTSDSYALAFGIRPTASGQHVSPIIAENLSAVLACVGAISSVMAGFPAYVYRITPEGRVELPDHPVARLTRRPNAHQTWPDWVEFTMGQALLYGNAVSQIEYDGAGRPTALIPIPWRSVSVTLLPTGRLAYDVIDHTAPWGGSVRSRRLLEHEVFHLRDRSDEGLVGRSRISRAPDVLGNAMALQEWSGTMWKNGATPSGALKFDTHLNEDQFRRISARLEQQLAGPQNARRIMVLESGASWQALSVSPEDAEVLASRRFSVEEVCRLFQVPPPIVQDLSHGTFTNSREAGRWFAQFTLAPWARKIEAEFGRSVFGASSADCVLELDMSALMRGDAEARWASHKIAVEAGILDPDEIREIEGWNPRRRTQQQVDSNA
ncbi:MAG: phage portal protein [Acetobacteraceae bacterium]|nr:phage portal protein [Acetobacteraceae bacterium]